MSATTLTAEPPIPEVVHSCPNCSHWLPDGTLACPDCQTLTYGRHLSDLAGEAQALEGQGKWSAARERWRATLEWMPENAAQGEQIRQHITGIDTRLNTENEKKARWTRRLGPLAPAFFFLLKIKSALFLLFKLKFLLGLLSFFGLYWAIFGWRFALGFTVCLFIHEMGHFVAVKRRGLKADLPMFFPGLGAYVRWYSMGVSRPDLAAIALAGPTYGLLAAVACGLLYLATGHGVFLVLANTGAWVNLFNLLPLLGLDGAQATYALSRFQRGMIAATFVLFFALTAAGESGAANIQWVFLIVAAGMAWRAFGTDVPEKPDTRTFVTFQVLIVLLGLVLYRSALLLNVTQASWSR